MKKSSAKNPPRTKQDFLKRLYESDRYKQALAAARTPEERARLAGLVTEFVGSFADVLAPLIDRAQRDPAFAQQLGRAVMERQRVVTSSGPARSGSVG
jgi:hypothetical protein